jgi:3-methylcrotonyl-CoA carboxylase alpha subunit
VAAVSLQISLDGRGPRDVRVTRSGDTATVWIDGAAFPTRLRPDGGASELSIDGRRESVWIVTERDTVFVHAFGRAWRLEVTDPVERSMRAGQRSDAATAPMPGVVVAISVRAGDEVSAGQQLAVIESMKMHTEILAPRAGRVERVLVEVGETFGQGAPLVALEPESLPDETDEEGPA